MVQLAPLSVSTSNQITVTSHYTRNQCEKGTLLSPMSIPASCSQLPFSSSCPSTVPFLTFLFNQILSQILNYWLASG